MMETAKGRVTPFGLAALYVLGGVVGAALGTTPLAAWLDTVGANRDSAMLRDMAPAVEAFGVRTGLDWPYKQLHQAIRNVEASKFSGPR
jgi:hypothetical protein